jgi:DNA transformation protein
MAQPIKDYTEYIVGDVLGHIPTISSRAMFGGYGLYYEGVIFGIITDVDELRFKVDDSNRKQYENMGSTPFVYTGHKDKKPSIMQYYLVPTEIQEDRERVEEWLLQSVEISKQKKKGS